LGHSGSAIDPALVGPPQSACANVLWFDLGLDDDAWRVIFSSMAVSPFFIAGSRPGGLVTHEDTPPAAYFHTI
jgi:hypothetical protein